MGPGHQLGGRAIFEDVAAGPYFHAFHQVVFVIVHGEKKDLRLRTVLLDLPGGFEAAETGHADVHENDVWTEFGCFFDGVAAIGSFANHFHIGFRGNQGSDALAEECVVVRQHDASLGHILYPS